MRKDIRSALGIAVMFAVLGFSACQPQGLAESQRGGVTFTVRTVDAPPTKASIYPEGALAKGAELGLVAYTYQTDKAEADTWTVLTKPALTPLVLDDSGSGGNRTDGSGKWIPAPGSRLLWPREGFVRYFGFAPYSAVSGTFTDKQAPVLAYSVPEALSNQVDLLVGTPGSTRQYSGDPSWRKIDVPMDLQHALTGVRFRIVDGLSIDNVTVSGVYGAGELDLTAAPLSWTLTGASNSNYSMTSPNLVADSSWSGFNVTDGANTFLLMPQVLPAGAKIEVSVSKHDISNNPVPGTEKTVSAFIGGQVWKPCTLVTYTITRDPGGLVLFAGGVQSAGHQTDPHDSYDFSGNPFKQPTWE